MSFSQFICLQILYMYFRKRIDRRSFSMLLLFLQILLYFWLNVVNGNYIKKIAINSFFKNKVFFTFNGAAKTDATIIFIVSINCSQFIVKRNCVT